MSGTRKTEGRVAMALRLAEDVRREPEQVEPRTEGRPERLRQVAAQRNAVQAARQAGARPACCQPGPGRRAASPAPRAARGPESTTSHARFAPCGAPDRVRDDRIRAVEHRVRPPRQHPDEEIRVVPVPDHVSPRVRDDRNPGIEERDEQIRAERGERCSGFVSGSARAQG